LPVDVRFDLPRQDNGAGLFRDVKDGLADFGGGGHIGRMFEIPHDSTEGAGFRSAGLFLLAHRNRSGGRRGRRTIQRLQAFLGVAGAIIAESSLSFLGLGVQPPQSSWGNLLAEAPNYYLAQPWLMLWPGLAVLLTTLAFNLLGDGLRDAFDPRAAH